MVPLRLVSKSSNASLSSARSARVLGGEGGAHQDEGLADEEGHHEEELEVDLLEEVDEVGGLAVDLHT